MANRYAIDFGFDMGEAQLGGTANMQWGLARSTDGGATWQHFDPRQSIDKNAVVTVSIFNISDSRGLNAVVDGGVISSVKATDAPADQTATAPWTRTPTVAGGTPTPGGTSAGLDLSNVPGRSLCSFACNNKGHFAVTLEITVNGDDYTFREDPELVIGGGSGSGN